MFATCPHCAEIAPTRRSVIAGLAAAAVLPRPPPPAAAPSAGEDERFMRIAIAEARRADFPFGAVIVRDGKLLARGRNLGRTTDDPTAHGEMVAIRRCARAPRQQGAARRDALHLGRAVRDVHGRDPVVRLRTAGVRGLGASSSRPRSNQIMMSSADLAAKAPFAPIAITGGVLADEAMRLFAK